MSVPVKGMKGFDVRDPMAMTELPQRKAERLAWVGLTTRDAEALSCFYEHALGFSRFAAHWNGWNLEPRAADGVAHRIVLGVGKEVIELRQFDRPGRPYPSDASASDLCFQHFAIVVADMTAAYRKLCSFGGWSPISTDGPQRLPPSSGGVEAFKFRDPDGHPLELLAFPEPNTPQRWRSHSKAALFLGIDHSAISISDSRQSIAFYETLGLRLVSRSVNSGSEQARLDGLTAPLVEVAALAPRQATPHVELLCYRSDRRAGKLDLAANDVAASQLVLEMTRPPAAIPSGPQNLIDPDGHHLVLVESVGVLDPGNADTSAAGLPPVNAYPEYQ